MNRMLYTTIFMFILGVALGGALFHSISQLETTQTEEIKGFQTLQQQVQTEINTPEPEPIKSGKKPLRTNDELPSPSDWIKENQIHVQQDKIIIDLENAQWARFADTNSMDPVFDAGSNAIEIIPTAAEQIKEGDIVSYDAGQYGTIIHRIIETGYDENGWYAKFQGDNNPLPDPYKVRWSQIRRLVVAIIY